MRRGDDDRLRHSRQILPHVAEGVAGVFERRPLNRRQIGGGRRARSLGWNIARDPMDYTISLVPWCYGVSAYALRDPEQMRARADQRLQDPLRAPACRSPHRVGTHRIGAGFKPALPASCWA